MPAITLFSQHLYGIFSFSLQAIFLMNLGPPFQMISTTHGIPTILNLCWAWEVNSGTWEVDAIFHYMCQLGCH